MAEPLTEMDETLRDFVAERFPDGFTMREATEFMFAVGRQMGAALASAPDQALDDFAEFMRIERDAVRRMDAH